MNEPPNKDVKSFSGIPLKKMTKKLPKLPCVPKFTHAGKSTNGIKRTKDEMNFYDAYGIFPQNDEQLISFVKSRKAEKGFAKYDRFNRETE